MRKRPHQRQRIDDSDDEACENLYLEVRSLQKPGFGSGRQGERLSVL